MHLETYISNYLRSIEKKTDEYYHGQINDYFLSSNTTMKENDDCKSPSKQ